MSPGVYLVIRRWVELVLLLVVPPWVWYANVWRPSVLLALGVLAGYALVMLLIDPTFDRKNLWRWSAVRGELSTMLLLFVAGIVTMSLLLWIVAPDRFFELIRQRPAVWVIVMLAYPVLSVYPQELLYRAYFFHRFAALFRSRWMMILASAVLFCWAHILFQHWIPLVSTLIGGLIFAWRYDRTRSLASVSIEHAMYGQLIFTIGLGAYFYEGTIRATGG